MQDVTLLLAHYCWSICQETNSYYLYKGALMKNQNCFELFFFRCTGTNAFVRNSKCLSHNHKYFQEIFMYELYFSHFKNYSWRMVFSKSSEKNSRCFLWWDLSIESSFLQFTLPGVTKSPVWTHFQMYGIAFFSLPATFLENGMSEKFWKKFQLFLSVKPII